MTPLCSPTHRIWSRRLYWIPNLVLVLSFTRIWSCLESSVYCDALVIVSLKCMEISTIMSQPKQHEYVRKIFFPVDPSCQCTTSLVFSNQTRCKESHRQLQRSNELPSCSLSQREQAILLIFSLPLNFGHNVLLWIPYFSKTTFSVNFFWLLLSARDSLQLRYLLLPNDFQLEGYR